MTGNGNGGARPGAGRKPKADELKLIELLSPFEDTALEMLRQGVEKGDHNFIKLYMEYRFGKPKQTIDANLTGELLVNWFEEKNYDDADKPKKIEGGD